MVVVEDAGRRGQLDAGDRRGLIEGARREIGQSGIEAEFDVELRTRQRIGEYLGGPVDASAPVAEVRTQPIGGVDLETGHRVQDMADLLQLDNARERPALVCDVEPGGGHPLDGIADAGRVIAIVREGCCRYVRLERLEKRRGFEDGRETELNFECQAENARAFQASRDAWEGIELEAATQVLNRT